MLRLAFDFIIAWREIRARPNAYAHACKPYSLHIWAVHHTHVGYKLIAVKVGLLSHDNRIYTD
ncbi:hypothetical protein HMPREF0106_01466 [Bacteroides sp. D22]|nr:hypothetical protein HMPREF0106_01466 [Bacteroides sp. D22]